MIFFPGLMVLSCRDPPPCPNSREKVVAELPVDGVAPRFESFNLWGDFAGPDSVFNDAWGMIFNACRSHYDYLIRATGFFCPVEGCSGDGGGVFQSKGMYQSESYDCHLFFRLLRNYNGTHKYPFRVTACLPRVACRAVTTFSSYQYFLLLFLLF